MSYLYLARHTKSEWNEKGLWTGWADPSLSKEGFVKALKAGESIKKEKIDIAYVATLKRAKETLEEIKKGMEVNFRSIESPALNERNYGIFTGKNKWQIREEVGEEEFQKIRRGFDHKIQDGETLKDVYNRVVPYFKGEILPNLAQGKNVLVVSSGNSLRALIKYLENISDLDIGNFEIKMGEIIRYKLDEGGNFLEKKQIYSGTPDKPNK